MQTNAQELERRIEALERLLGKTLAVLFRLSWGNREQTAQLIAIRRELEQQSEGKGDE